MYFHYLIIFDEYIMLSFILQTCITNFFALINIIKY